MKSIIQRRYLFFKSARVILDDDLFFELVKKRKYSYIIGISHNQLKVPKYIKIKRKKTINIYLDKRLDDVFRAFNDTSRNEIRKTFRMPEFSFVRNHKDFKEVYKVYKAFRKNKKMDIKSPSFLKAAMLFKAYYKGELISVITCYDAFPYLRIQNIFSKLHKGDKDLRRLIGYATRRLVYEICKYGNEGGYKLLDLAGVNLVDPKKAGITQFKSSFGGKIENEYTYTYKSPIARMLIFIRDFIRKCYENTFFHKR